jgi:hypothetical protein
MSTLHRLFAGIDMRTKLPRQAAQACRSPRHRDAVAALLAVLPMLFAGGLCVHAATKPGPSRDIGYIERIVGDLKNIRIERQGKSLQPAILLPLRADDRIFLGQGSEVSLQLGNRRIVIAEKDSPYRVPVVDAPPAFVTRLRSTLLSLGAKLTSQYTRSSVPVSTSSRGHGGPLFMPVVEDENSRLGTHRTALNLAWEGGTAPFVVEMLSGQGQRLAKQERVENWRLRLMFGTASIPEGPVHIIVEDSTGTRISKLIHVVPASALPARTPQSDIPPALHAVIAADELIRTNHKQWGLEAYQDLAGLAASYEPARLLRDCLEAVPTCYQP